MNNISYNDFKNTKFYSTFIKNNSGRGYLKVIVSTASEAVPIVDAEVVVYQDIENYRVIFYRGRTDSSGIIDNIELPSPNSVTFGSLEVPEYAIYKLDIKANGYVDIYDYIVGVFSNIKVIQNVNLEPVVKIEK